MSDTTDIQPVVLTPAKPFGLVAVYDTPGQLYHACEALRDAGYKSCDAHTPFPVHGLENAMGIAVGDNFVWAYQRAEALAAEVARTFTEAGLDAVQMNREAVILESADMLYHLAVVWAECGVAPQDVFNEIDRRERIYGIAEKLPKTTAAAHVRRLSTLASRRKAAS